MDKGTKITNLFFSTVATIFIMFYIVAFQLTDFAVKMTPQENTNFIIKNGLISIIIMAMLYIITTGVVKLIENTSNKVEV